MQIINNDKKIKHLNTLIDLIGNADEIVICMAFLKISGLQSIISKLKNKAGLCTFFVGTDFYSTEPDALKKLFEDGHKIYLTKKPSSTFHPKAYYFRQRNKIALLIGSANLTGGGLKTNFELSILIKSEKGSAVDNSFKEIVENYSKYSKIIENQLEIIQYEKEFQLYHKKIKKAEKEFNEEIRKANKFDLTQLDRLIEEYKDDGGFERFAERIMYYKDARKYLNEITRKRINSANNFLYYYEDIAKSFHSSGLLRGKKNVCEKIQNYSYNY